MGYGAREFLRDVNPPRVAVSQSDVEFNYSIDMMPVGSGKGMVSVGKIRWDLYDGKNTTESILKHTPTEDVLQSYAEAEPGDAMMRYLDKGGHALLVTKPAKVKGIRTARSTRTGVSCI